MSQWTHVVGAINVDVHRSIQRERFQEWLESRVKLLPKITGSERDADVYVNEVSGHNSSLWLDGQDEPQRFQSEGVITIYGDLRDMSQEEVEEDLNKFFTCIINNLGWTIDQYSIVIEDELENELHNYRFNLTENL